MSETQFKPCPFCGDEHFGIMDMTYMHADGKRKGKRIKCNTCGAMAPDSAWNERATHAMPKSEDTNIAAMRNALEAVSGMFWVEQTTKNEIYESIHYPGPNKFNRQSLAKHISQLLRELDGEIFENNILATPQPSTDVSELKGKLDIAIEALRALDDNGNARIALDAIAKHTVK